MVKLVVRDNLCDALVDRIVRGALPAGLPLSLVELSEELGVSVTPLREAMIKLTAQGFVYAVPARGFFVSPLDAKEVREIYPIVGALEALALRCGPPQPKRLPDIQTINDRLAGATTPRKKIELDEQWHATLLSDCPNSTLLEHLELLKLRTSRYGYVFLTNAAAGENAVREHNKVMDFLRRGQIDAAADALQDNWRSGPEHYVKLLEERAQPLRMTKSRRVK